MKMASRLERAVEMSLLRLLLYALLSGYCIVGAYIFIKLENLDGHNQVWSFGSAVLLSFQILTTIGYGHVAPATFEGKLFCIFYTIIGIPFFFLVILDLAASIKAYIILLNKVCLSHATRFIRSKKPLKVASLQRKSAGTFYLISLCGLFILYSVFGAFLFTLYESSAESPWSFYDSFYFCIISLTTIGFGDMSPSNWEYLAVTIIYVTFGIALVVLFSELIADCARKLHHIGAPVTNSRFTLVQFGSKNLSVEELLLSVAHHCDVDQDRLRSTLDNLDAIIELAIVAKGKRELTGDDNVDGNEMSPLENGRAFTVAGGH